MNKQIRGGLQGFAIACILVATVTAGIYCTTSRALVGIDQHGECKWVELAPEFERRDCPMVLPENMQTVHVMSVDEVKELMQ